MAQLAETSRAGVSMFCHAINLNVGRLILAALLISASNYAFGWGAPKILEAKDRAKTYAFSTKLDKKRGFTKLLVWSAKTFADSNESIKMKDADLGLLVIKGNLPCKALKLGSGYGENQRLDLAIEATVENKKAEVKITDIVGRSDGSYDDGARPSTKEELAAAAKECLDPFVEQIKAELN